ncbi:MAG: hypothetical protein DHS20C13_12090 [Thermodesulfobacteriota bacterium]|nr:MAG: hypothetical protein DHS20C13_12090 [Thermodesulfobacteriota bacterium]
MIRAMIVIVFILCVYSNFLYAMEKKSEYKETQVKRGEQLVNEGRCNDCHTPAVQTPEGLQPDSKRKLSGHPSDSKIPEVPNADVDSQEWMNFVSSLDSTIWAGEWGLSFSANLTPDPKTGIGKWNEEIFIEIMRTGRHIDLNRDIKPPMPWQDYSKLSDEDLNAIFIYLATLKPINNAVPKPVPLSKN